MKFGLHYRPAAVCAVPEGPYTVTESDVFRHGVIEYERQLSQSEIANFQLTPIVSVQDHAVMLIADMGRYSRSYRNNQAALSDFVSARYAQHGVWSTSDLDELVAEVTRQVSA